MIKIVKYNEPNEWRRHRLTPGASYEPTFELRQSLAKEQGYICAYCTGRLTLSDGTSSERTRIEHIKAQSIHKELSMDYHNMVLCCTGCRNEKDPSTFHCDRKKEERDLLCSPLSDEAMGTISYKLKDGTICSSNKLYDTELNTILNLNIGYLKDNRFQALEGVLLALAKKHYNNQIVKNYLKIYANPDQNNMKYAYCGIVIWFLKKKIKSSKTSI